jgi:hypothetical protein
MWGRLFGRGRDDGAELSCAQCGRTVLAGEWTQRVTGDKGEGRILCSLCADVDQAQSEPAAVATTPAGSGRVKASRSDSDAFWKALKDKDVEIERLHAHLARAEAERQELAARLAQLQRQFESAGVPMTAAAPVAPPVAATPVVQPPDIAVPVTAVPVAAESGGAAPAPPEPPAEHTQEMPAIAAASPQASAAAPSAETPPAAAPVEPELKADEAQLTLLQRGVDLLNVSPVPRRIAETNENLGMSSVHIGFESQELLATFMWSMGWYRFAVNLGEGGSVRMLERGYEQRTDLRPNATVRADGTVHLAPAQIKRPSASQKDDLPPSPPLATKGEIISKSMMGQRTDDAPPPSSWEQTKSGDFDWGR